MEKITRIAGMIETDLDQLKDIPSFRDDINNSIMLKYEQLLYENNLNPILHEPVISFDTTSNTTTVKIGVKPINPIKHSSFVD